jgi:hypothetical protein
MPSSVLHTELRFHITDVGGTNFFTEPFKDNLPQGLMPQRQVEYSLFA